MLRQRETAAQPKPKQAKNAGDANLTLHGKLPSTADHIAIEVI
ncbi:hypothetical protein [Polaromonas sp. CG9_12]|nr:hypothetical protein [Polaromonas sp. CG9_12]